MRTRKDDPKPLAKTAILALSLLAVLALLQGQIGQTPAVSAETAAQTTVIYPPSDDIFANPERGFYLHTETHSNAYTPLNTAVLQNYRLTQNISLILRVFYLDDFVSGPIAQTYLDAMAADFGALRAAGMKAVVRVAYTNQVVGWPPGLPYGDATKAQMLAHVAQLAPVLQANSDVISVIQAGFIGIWGEWYYTDHFVADPSNPGVVSDFYYDEREEILSALLDAVPNRMAQLRTPLFKQKLFGTGTGAGEALPPANAFDGSNRARTGHHNDCFLASSTDFGTYADVTQDKAFLAEETKYLPMGGETCNPNPPRSQCPTALAELAQFHWSYLNSSYHPDVLTGWETEGCMDTVKRSLGYRFALLEGTYPDTAQAGGNLDIDIDLQNVGWAAPFNPRPVDLVLRNQTTLDVHRFPLTADPRLWLADGGGLHNITQSISLPGSLPAGDYDLFLALPDADSVLAAQPAFAIRFANAGVWEASEGWNNLLHTVTVENQPAACELYPIALHNQSIAGLQTGDPLTNIPYGKDAGAFGWLTWDGNPALAALVTSLTAPGNSNSYVNPFNPSDHTLGSGEWVEGRGQAGNNRALRDALTALINAQTPLVVPLWDNNNGSGQNLDYRVSGFARIQLTGYTLAGQDAISVIFLGSHSCPDNGGGGDVTLIFGHDLRRDTIVAINPATGQAMKIGPTGSGTAGDNTTLTGLATAHTGVTGPGASFYPAGTHFGLWRDKSDMSDWVVQVDIDTGAGNQVVQTSKKIAGRGIAFGPDNKLFVMESDRRLSWIDPATGQVHLVGRVGHRSVSLDYNPNDGYLYAISNTNSLLRIDPATAQATVVGGSEGLLGGGKYCTLVRTDGGEWYSVNTASDQLVRIDAGSGTIGAVVGPLGSHSSGQICGTVSASVNDTAFFAARAAFVAVADEELAADLLEVADEWSAVERSESLFLPLIGAEQ